MITEKKPTKTNAYKHDLSFKSNKQRRENMFTEVSDNQEAVACSIAATVLQVSFGSSSPPAVPQFLKGVLELFGHLR